jgi:hypothetical protein
MFNIFNLKNLRPMMDEDGAIGGTASSTETGTEGTQAGEQTGSATGTEGAQGEGTSGGTESATQTKQTPEQNAAFAQMRRDADQAKREAEQAKRDVSIAKKYGQEYGVFSEEDIAAKWGAQGIKTLADMEAALQKEEYKAKGIDPDLINELVANHPDIKAAKAQQGQAVINAELSELASEYPDLKINTLADMQALPNFEAIKAKAYKGMTLLEAYEAVNRAEIRQRAKEEGAQGAIRNIGSKAHLGTEKSGNTQPGKEVEVSAEKMRVWKAMGYTEAQARQKEAKYLKK